MFMSWKYNKSEQIRDILWFVVLKYDYLSKFYSEWSKIVKKSWNSIRKHDDISHVGHVRIMRTRQNPSLNHFMSINQQRYLPIHPYWSISTATLAPVMHTYRCVREQMWMMHLVPMVYDVACMTSGAFSWCFFTSHRSHDHTFRLPLPILLPQDRTL